MLSFRATPASASRADAVPCNGAEGVEFRISGLSAGAVFVRLRVSGEEGGCRNKAPYNIEVHSGIPKEVYWCCNYSDLVFGV